MVKINKKLLAWLAAFILTISSFATPFGNYGKAYAKENIKASYKQEAKEEIENKISPELKEEFANKSQTTFLVKLKDQVDTVKVANEVKAKNKSLTSVKKELVVRSSIVSELRIKADSSQRNLKKYIEKEKVKGNVKDYNSFYIVNGMAITATEEVMRNIAAMPEVESIKPNGITKLIEPEKTSEAAPQAVNNVEWNLEKIGVPDVWSLGIDGTGIVVANIDTGVQWDHPALKTKYRGYDPNNLDNPNNECNWFDATSDDISAPYDDNGHGTHTMGTMVGSEPNGTNKIGVAPGAKWIAVKAFTPDGGEDADLIEAGEWILAPKDKDGNPHPEKAPNVVNNSWGGSPVIDDWYRTIVTNWIQAGIFPAFAAGNTDIYNPGGPGSVANPANYPESFATGAVDINGKLGNFSLRGPSPYGGIIKPEISAPGVNIRSSVPGSEYEGGWNGTSMAGPHTAGLVALLLQANSSLTIEDIERIIKDTATPRIDEEYPKTPNNGYGYGIINAFKAVSSVMEGLGEIKGQVLKGDGEDIVLPTFNHTPITEAFERMEQLLTIDVQDDIGIVTVELQYKNNPEDDWTTATALRENGDYKSGRYTALIPADKVVVPNIYYRWRIVDFGNHEVISDPYTILVNPGIKMGYFNDFETDIEGWESTGTHQWQWGKPTTGPMAAASGENVIATNLSGTYSDNADMTMKMPPIDLPEGNAYLQFTHWYETENWFDNAFVKVSTDNEAWTTLATYMNASNGYVNEEIDLSQYAGKRIYIEFIFKSDISTNKQGWFIDDVRITNQSAAPDSTSALNSTPKEEITASAGINAQTAGLPLSAAVSVVENGRSTQTNPADGSYSLKIQPGEYTLRAETYGYYPQDKTVQVAADKVTENVNFTMMPIPKGTLTGKITNAQTGEPVENATIYLIEDAAIAPVKTDADGNYSITAYEGKYTVQVMARDYFGERFTVDILANESVSHDVQLNPFIGYSGEIGYDDGTAENASAYFVPGYGFAVRMSLLEGKTSAVVTSGLFKFWNMSWPNPGGNTFKVAVFDASGANGAPGKLIAGPFDATAIRDENVWTVVDLSDKGIAVTGDYYMVYIQDGDNKNSPGITFDEDGENAKRTWSYVGGSFNLDKVDGNCMIRSTVKYEAQSPDISSPANNSYFNNENVTITGMAAPGMDVHLFNNDEDIATGKANDDGSFSIDTVLQEGVNILKARTTAENGWTPFSEEVKVIVDKAVPVLKITSPQDGENTNNQVITVTGTVKDDYIDYVDINGTKADIDENGNWTAKIMSEEGENVLNVIARDKAGNETVKSITVNVKYSVIGITNLKPDQDLKLNSGDVVKVEFDSEPGLKKAAFRIISPIGDNQTAAVSENEIPMAEELDKDGKGTGHYVGQWIVPNDIVLNGGQIEVIVEDNSGNEMTAMAGGKLYINCKLTPPVLAADAVENEIGKAIELTFTDDAAWREKISDITVDGASIADQYTVSEGKIEIKAGVFPDAKSYTIEVVAEGYNNAVVVQTINTPGLKIAPALTSDTTDNIPGKDIGITFVDDADWRNAIADITLDGTSVMDKCTVAEGSITIDTSLFKETKDYTLTIKASGYTDTSVIQTIAKEVQPEPPLTIYVPTYISTPGPSIPPMLMLDLADNTLGNAIEITFPDVSAWRSAITDIKVNDVSVKDKCKVEAGKITIEAGVFTKTNIYTIKVIAKGYLDTQTAQPILPVPMKEGATLIADIDNSTVGNSISIEFEDNSEWKAAIKDVLVDGISIDGKYTVNKDNITINSEIFSKPRNYKIVVKAEGFSNSTVTQKVAPKQIVPPVAAPKKIVIVTASRVNIRAASSIKSKILTTVSGGCQLEYLGTYDQFYKVKYNGRIGYISTKYSKLFE